MVTKICSCGKTFTTRKKTQKFCGRTCWSKSRIGSRAPNWKGGRRLNGNGYVLIYQPTHPVADRHGYIFEHRWVMEQKLERLLEQYEIVHHLDGNKQNNQPDNLVLTRHGIHEQTFHKGHIRKERIPCPTPGCNGVATENTLCRRCYKRNWRQQKREKGEKYT